MPDVESEEIVIALSETVLLSDATILTHTVGKGTGNETVNCCPAFDPPDKVEVFPHCIIHPFESLIHPFVPFEPVAPPPTGCQLPDWQLPFYTRYPIFLVYNTGAVVIRINDCSHDLSIT